MMGPTMPTGESLSDLEENQSEAEEEAVNGEDSDEAPQLVDMAEADLIEAIKANGKKRKQSHTNGAAAGEASLPIAFSKLCSLCA